MLPEKVDALFAEWDKPDSPGCALAVVQNGEIVYKRGYGMADLEHDVPITPASVFDIASVSKQFTAACVALLARQGKLSLDDPIHKYLSELPEYAYPVTVGNLVYHTSGLRDYIDTMEAIGMRVENDYPEEEIIALIARDKDLLFQPGTVHAYDNTGYFLLGVIMQRAAGIPLSVFAHEHIFAPLGMTNTHFHDDFTRIVKNRAVAYAPRSEGGFKISMSIFDVVGDGQVYTTVEDLYLWDDNFYHNILGGGGQDFIDELTTPGRLNNGERFGHAFGLVIDEYRGLRTIHHDGDWMGYRAELMQFPDQRFSVICLANLATIDTEKLARDVADLYLT